MKRTPSSANVIKLAHASPIPPVVRSRLRFPARGSEVEGRRYAHRRRPLFCIFFVVIDVGANIFASMSMTWFVLGETGQEEELV